MQTSGNIDDLVARIMEKAKVEAAGIIERAERVATLDVSRARDNAKRKLASAKALLDEQFKAKHEAVRAELTINERRLIMERQEKAIDTVFAEALRNISQNNDERQRGEMLLKMLKESIDVLGVEQVRVKLNPTDRALAEKENLFTEIDTVTVIVEEETINVSGGLLVSDTTGRIVHDNTFEARLERQRGELRAKIADIFEFRKAGNK